MESTPKSFKECEVWTQCSLYQDKVPRYKKGMFGTLPCVFLDFGAGVINVETGTHRLL